MNEAQELLMLAAHPHRWTPFEETRVRELITMLVKAPAPVDHGKPLLFHCKECGKDHEYVLLDGYYFGDRTLEGIPFQVRRYQDGTWALSLYEKYKPCMSGLNVPYWLRQGAKYAAKRDLFTCPNPKCKADVSNQVLSADPE